MGGWARVTGAVPGRDEVVAGVWEWLGRFGRVHADHVRADIDGLVLAGMTRPEGGRMGVRWDLAHPHPLHSGSWGRWNRTHWCAVLDDGTPLSVEARQVVHGRECASTTCIALWRRMQAYTSATLDADYLRMDCVPVSVSSPPTPDGRYGFAVVVDREHFDDEHRAYTDWLCDPVWRRRATPPATVRAEWERLTPIDRGLARQWTWRPHPVASAADYLDS